jgi:hypothetical protein
MPTDFPWDAVVASVSTLVAALGGAWVARGLAHRDQTRYWKRDRLSSTAAALLRAWSDFYLALSKAATQGRSSLDAAGEWTGPVVDTDRWNAALEELALVATVDVIHAAHTLDREMWRLSSRVAYLGALANREWLSDTRAAKDARVEFVNVVRRALGDSAYISDTWGKPAPDDPIWDPEFWKNERIRLTKP